MKRKKLLSILLAFILSTSLAMPTFAAEIPQAEKEAIGGETMEKENSEVSEESDKKQDDLEEPEENNLTEASSNMEISDKMDVPDKSKVTGSLEENEENNEPKASSDTVISEIEDFIIEGTVIQGFSESGLVKLETIKDVIIPEKNASGEAITEIGTGAFKEKGIVSVVFPNTLETIGGTAFQTNNLKQIILPDSVKTVGDGAFTTNPEIEKIKLSNSMKDIPKSFAGMSGTTGMEKFTELDIPNGIKTIGDRAFTGHNIQTLTIPASVETIGGNAFSQLPALRSLEKLMLSEGLVSIGSRAFQNTKIKEVELPTTVTSVDKNAFNGCAEAGQQVKLGVADKEQFEKLSSQVTASSPHKIVYRNLQGSGWSYDDFEYDGTKVIGWSAKGNLTKLTNKKLVVPNVNPETEALITEIGDLAFKSVPAEGIKSVELPETIEVIGTKAFAGNNLSKVTIPAKVTSIAKDAFVDNSEVVVLEISNKDFLNALIDAKLENVKLMTHISACEINVEKAVYTGEELFPKVIIKYGDDVLVEGVDYIVDSYSDNINAGTAKVYIKGNGNYVGSTVKYFTIDKAEREITVRNIPQNMQLGETASFFLEGEEGRTIRTSSQPAGAITVNIKGRTISASKLGTAQLTIYAAENDNYQKSKEITFSILVKGNMEENSEWKYEDFTYKEETIGTSTKVKVTVTGLSDSGKQKILTNKNLVIPDMNPETKEEVSVIGENAFASSGESSYGITSVQIPGTITDVGKCAFAGNKLTEVMIPKKLVNCELDAFSDNETPVKLILCQSSVKDKFSKLDNVLIALDISICSIEVANALYTGSAVTPEIAVKDGDILLTEGTDYVIESCSNNVNVGIAKVVIKGIGDNYAGCIDRYFAITKADMTASISPSSIKVGEKAQITAVCGEGVVTYESKDKDIAIVDEKGVVTGVAVGKAEITISSEGDSNYKAGSCTVILTVLKPDDDNNDDNNNKDDNDNNNNSGNNNNITESNPDIKVNKITISGITKKVAAGKKIKLTAKVSPQNATNKTVKWISENPKVAKVNNAGVVTVKKKTGGKKVVIKAVASDGSGIKASYKLTIMKDSVKSIKLKAKKTVKAGKSLKVKATVKTTGKKVNKKLKWTSSNEKYATVTSKGVVKAKKAGKGKTVKITAASTDGSNKKKVIKIKIK